MGQISFAHPSFVVCSKENVSLKFGKFPSVFHRSHRRGDPASPYFVNSGYIFAPATSANDSEISSDATTDDSMSMTDSSV